MTIITKIKDGAGSAVRATVFDNRMRELEVQQSAANHISTAQLGGRTGVFTVGLNRFISSMINGAEQDLLSISNNDPINLLIINRIYIQIFSCSLTLPNTGLSIAISRTAGTTTNEPIIINENKVSKIIPLAESRNLSGEVASISTINIPRLFPTLGDAEDIIPQGSDGIILPGKISPAVNVSDINTVATSIFNSSGSSISYGLNGFIRFMMVPPGELG